MKYRNIASLIAILTYGLLSSDAAANALLDEAERLSESNSILFSEQAGKSLTAGMDKDEIKEALSNFKKLKWTQILPVGDLIMVENDKGEHFLMDTNARIAIRGDVEVYDMWNKRPITNQQSAKDAWLVSLDTFNINQGDLPVFSYGADRKDGKADVTVLVDPNGDFNSKLFKQIEALSSDYSFDIVLVPLLGEPSVMSAIKLWCAKDRDNALRQLMSQQEPVGTMFATCDKDPIIRAVGLAGLLRLKGLPHLIRADGLNLAGSPDNVLEFLTRDATKLGEVKVDGI